MRKVVLFGTNRGGGSPPADDRFIFTVKTDNAGTSTDTQFTIPTSTSGITEAFLYDIETSDGQTITGVTGDTTITFPSAGEYDVKISGSFPYMYFNNGGDKLKLLDIKNFGIYALGSTSQDTAFRGCSNMVITATDSGNFGSVTNFKLSLAFCSSLTSFPLLDTSSGTTFENCWRNCSSLTLFPLIDTSSGVNFNNTWNGCSGLTSFPLIDTSSGTNFSSAWRGCSNLTSFPLINTSSGTNFLDAWNNCSSLATFPANAFDGNIATNYSNAFLVTNLTTQSIDDILVSLDTSGVSNGTFTQSGGQAPSATGEAAIDSLVGKGWTITVTGGYQPILFPNWEDNNVDGSVFMTALNNYVPQTFNKTIDTFDSLSGANKWAGGVLAPNGKIYGIPFSSTQVLEIDPATNTTTLFGSLSGGGKWIGGVLAPNGKIYGIPLDATSVLEIDPVTQTTTTFGTLTGSVKWNGGVLAPNGKIYGIPFDSSTVLEIDPVAQTVNTFGSLSGGGNKWIGGVLAPNGKIYGVPFNSTQVLEIDPATNTTTLFGSLSSSNKWIGGVLAPNGKIYGVPFSSTQVLEIDSATNTTTLFGSLSGSSKWRSGVLATNGKIYGIPSSASEVLVIGDDNTQNEDFVLARYVNKY